jgi:hypothetical protein
VRSGLSWDMRALPRFLPTAPTTSRFKC